MKGVVAEIGELIEIGPPHPVADLFPMLSEDELDDLAADIKENGQIHPLTVTPQGELVDGRNRLEACSRLDITPTVEVFEGDPVAYILSTNITRRHLNKGQRAMITAKAYGEGIETIPLDEQALTAGSSRARIKYCRQVLRWAPDLVDPVIAGAMPLDEAVQKAREQKASTESAAAQRELLRSVAPDLAARVADETLSLAEALGALRARQQEDEKNRKVSTRLLSDSIIPLAQLKDFVEQTAGRYDPELATPGREVTADSITDAIEVLRQLKAHWRKAGL